MASTKPKLQPPAQASAQAPSPASDPGRHALGLSAEILRADLLHVWALTADVPALSRVYLISLSSPAAVAELNAVIEDRLERPGLTPAERQDMQALLSKKDGK